MSKLSDLSEHMPMCRTVDIQSYQPALSSVSSRDTFNPHISIHGRKKALRFGRTAHAPMCPSAMPMT
jgi:hypothetical protein